MTELDEIRARHKRDNTYGDGLYPGAHKDRAWLLAEVERLRGALQGIDALDPDALDALVASDLRVIVSQMAEIARAALKGKP